MSLGSIVSLWCGTAGYDELYDGGINGSTCPRFVEVAHYM